MVKAIVSDVARVLLFTKDKNYHGELNALHKELSSSGEYGFWQQFELNRSLLEFYETLKEQVDLYIFTSGVIQDVVELKSEFGPIFKKIFSASKMNVSKQDPQAYSIILNEINLSAQEVLFIDDSQENIDAAKQVGLHTVLYIGNLSTIDQVNSALSH